MSVDTEQGARVRLVARHRSARQPIRELNQSITVLGSGNGCDLILASSKVDASHAAIIRLNNTAYLCDLGAHDGTTLNGRRIRWARLTEGDLAALGPFTFKVELQEGPDCITLDQPMFALRNERSIGVVKSIVPLLLIGADSNCDVVLTGPDVSPRHALIAGTQDGFIIRDLQRCRSVKVNGAAVDSASLANGDRIGIGDVEMIFETREAATLAEMGETGRSAGSREPAEMPSIAIATDRPANRRSRKAARGPLTAGALPDVEQSSSTFARSDGRLGSEQIWTNESAAPAPNSANIGNLEDKENEFKARVVAAQNALDERARKLWDGLHAERERLKACQDELQQKSKELLGAAQYKQREFRAKEETLDKSSDSDDGAVKVPPAPRIRGHAGVSPAQVRESKPAPASPPSEPLALDKLFNGLFEPEAATLRNAEETARLAEVLVHNGFKTPEVDVNLARQAAELAELVRYEREEMECGEGRLETLRFEIERLAASITRTRERQRVQETQMDARMQSIRMGQAALRKEREGLASKIRQLEANDAALKARMEEADRVRREMEREARQLTKIQEDHEERRRELRLSLESERHRLRVRQAELQKKAAGLVKAAKEKRRLIESEVASKQAEIEEREVELKARRAALEDAGRAQLERTANELEQVLSVRLTDIESEVAKRQTELDQRMAELVAATGDAAKPADGPTATPLEMSLDEIASLARLEEVSHQGGAPRLEALQDEVEALRQAVGRIDEHEETLRSVSREAQLAALTSRRNQLQREQRWAGILRSKLNEKISLIQAGAETDAQAQAPLQVSIGPEHRAEARCPSRSVA